MLQELRDKGFEWQEKENTLISQLRSAGAGLPIAAVKQFYDALKQAPPDFKRLSPATNASHPSDAAKLIEDLAVEYAAARDLLDRFALRLEQEWRTITACGLTYGVHFSRPWARILLSILF